MSIILFISISAIICSLFIRCLSLFVEGIYSDSGINVVVAIFGSLGIIGCGLFLLFSQSFFIIPYTLYFVIGYIASLKIFPMLDAPNCFREGALAYELIMEIIFFYPVIILFLFMKNRQFKNTIFKTPISEYKKKIEKQENDRDMLKYDIEKYKEKLKENSNNHSSCGGFVE